jgi:hypothetical protein
MHLDSQEEDVIFSLHFTPESKMLRFEFENYVGFAGKAQRKMLDWLFRSLKSYLVAGRKYFWRPLFADSV